MNFSHEFWLQIGVYVIGGVVFVAINAYRVGLLEARLATKEELREKVKERDGIVCRVYERFDEHKRECNENFVRKDMCGQLHISSRDELARLDKDYKDFRHEIRNQFQQILDKIDELNRRINEKP